MSWKILLFIFLLYGPFPKWMSDPPPKDHIVKPLVDDQYASWYSYNWGGNRETLREEDRVTSTAVHGVCKVIN